MAHTGKRARARRDAHSTVPVRQRAQQQQGARSGAGHCGGTRGSMATLGEGEAQDRRSTAAGSAPPPRTPPPRAQEEGAARSPASAPAHSASAKHAASTARSPPSMPDMCVAFSFSPLLFREHVLFRPPVPSTGNLRIQDRTSVTHFVLFCPTLGTRRRKRGFANSKQRSGSLRRVISIHPVVRRNAEGVARDGGARRAAPRRAPDAGHTATRSVCCQPVQVLRRRGPE